MKTKEQVLESLKAHTTEFFKSKRHGDEIWVKEWKEKSLSLHKGMGSLSSCDILWVLDQYDAWIKAQKPSLVKELEASFRPLRK